MPAQTGVDILLRGKDKASPAIRKVDGELKNLKSSGERTTLSLVKTWAKVAAGVAVAGIAIKKAFDVSQLAARAQQIRKAYNTMFSNMGIDARKMLRELQVASAGTVSELQLMEAASRASILGLPLEKLPKLMEIARASATALGGDVTQMFSDIVTGIGRASPMILDNLGIMVKAGKATEEYARALGKSARELTQSEKQAALFNAVLKDGERIIKRVGDAATSFTALERWQKLSSTMTDIKVRLGEAIMPVFEEIANFAQKQLDKIVKWLNDHRTQMINFFLHFGEIAKVTFSAIGDMWRALFSPETFRRSLDQLLKMYAGFLLAFYKMIFDIYKAIADVVVAPFKFARDAVKATLQNLVIDFKRMINTLFSGVIKAFNWLQEQGARVQALGTTLRKGRAAGEQRYREIMASQTFLRGGKLFQDVEYQQMPQMGGYFKEAFAGFGEALNTFKDRVQEVKESGGVLREEFGNIFSELKDNLSAILNQTLKGAYSLTSGVTAGGKTPIEKAAFDIKKAAELFYKGASDIVTKSSAFGVSQPLSEMNLRYGGGFSGAEMGTILQDAFQDLFSGGGFDFGTAIQDMLPDTIPLTEEMQALAQNMSAFGNSLVQLVGSISGFTGQIMSWVIEMGPIGILFAFLKVILDGIFKILAPALNAVLAPLLNFLYGLGGIIGQMLIPVFDALTPIIQVLTSVLKDVFFPILQVLAPVLELVTEVFKILTPIIQFVATVFEALFTPVKAVVGVVTWMVDSIKTAVHNLIEWIKHPVNARARDTWAFKTLSDIMDDVADSITTAAEDVFDVTVPESKTGKTMEDLLKEYMGVGPGENFEFPGMGDYLSTIGEVTTPETAVYGGETTVQRVPDIYVYQTFEGPVIGEGGLVEVGEVVVDAIGAWLGTGARVEWLEEPPAGGE